MTRNFTRLALAAVTVVFVAVAARADLTLVAQGSAWRYKDDGSNLGTAWTAPAFDDSGWSSGAARLGYGEGDETTVVSYGTDAAAKYVTTYFRTTFQVADATSFTGLTLRLLRDDGAVVYLNGTEIVRSNMPSGTITSTTLAATTVSGADENTFFSYSLPPTALVTGTNVLAVEIHQDEPSSSDISFDLTLTGATTTPLASLTRGPYLQIGTPTSVHVRWRTDIATDSRVQYGPSPASLTQVVNDSTATTEHEVVLSALGPYTRYYYSVGSSTQTIGGDSTYVFRTSPTPGTAVPTRIWAVGDPGTADEEAAEVRNAYYTYTGSTETNLWLMLGDNAYETGGDAEYQGAVFDMYPSMLRQSVLWPAIGNHDTNQATDPPLTIPYFANFSMPTNGEAGGVPSGTEKYYSYDYGNIHFICLDSQTSDRSPTGTMANWLRSDLGATTRQWTIVYWHHPPYSKGSHDSDVDEELIEMRQNIVPILEQYGVDLVLCGHSHAYERSFLLDGHYDYSSTFTSAMQKDAGSGSGTTSYRKGTLGPGPHEGTVYAVAGSAGMTQAGALNHPAMRTSLLNLGSVVVDVNGNRLDAKFLRENGTVADSFTIIKGPSAAPGALTATSTSATAVALRWTDNANNESGFRIERCTGTSTQCDAAPANYAQIAQTATDITTYTDATVTQGTTYAYRVRSFNVANTNSAYSASAQTTTPVVCTAPSITTQPQSQTVTSGASATLSVAASGSATLSYQWFTGTAGDTTTPVASATTSSLAVSPAATTSYWVRVTNSCGTASSIAATVTVMIPCSYSLSGSSVSATAFAGVQGFDVTATPAGCQGSWTASSTDAWITFSRTSGTGSGSVVLAWAQNTGGSRSGSAIIAGTTVAVTQAAAPPPAGRRVAADYTGDGRSDSALYRPSTGVWYFATGASTTLGTSGDLPAPGDYDGDGRTDVAVLRPSNGTWYIVLSSTGATRTVVWGGVGDKPVPADYDGDGRDDIAVYRPSTGVWYIILSSNGGTRIVQLGGASRDLPSPADYDGDHKADPAIENPTTGKWQILLSSTGATRNVQWGGSGGDIPVPADYDGDGRADIAIESPLDGKWYIILSSNGGTRVVQWGGSGGDQPQPADFDGDGRADIAVYSGAYWYIVESSTGLTRIVLMGGISDVAVSPLTSVAAFR